MRKIGKPASVAGAIVLALGAGLGFLALLTRKDEVLGLNKEFIYDDFGFSADGVRLVRGIGSGAGAVTANGAFYLVRMKVANHARRVPFTFRTETAILFDSHGREYRVSRTGQAAIDSISQESANRESPIPPGGERMFELVFEVPEHLKGPRLRISGGGPFFDVVDLIFAGRKEIVLE